MTGFVHLDYRFEHPGVRRMEGVFAAFARLARGFDGARGVATLLLAAVVSALLVVTNEVVTSWSDGHLLAAWMASWTVAFAALAGWRRRHGGAPARCAAPGAHVPRRAAQATGGEGGGAMSPRSASR